MRRNAPETGPILPNLPYEKQETHTKWGNYLIKNQHDWQSENEADNNLVCHMFYFITYIPNINAKM